MTREEAITALGDRNCLLWGMSKEEQKYYSEALDMAISALSAEGEYIKKTDVLDKAVIETLSDYTEHDVIHVDEINKLPTYSVPKREKGTLETKIKRVEYGTDGNLYEFYTSGGYVIPEREKGEWIKIQSGDDKFPESIVCSKCKNENSHLDFDEHGEPIGKVFITSKFCSNCGADMRGKE